MKLIFFGSSDFAIPSLDYLNKNHQIVAVVTNPDRPKGRHLDIHSTSVKVWAEKTKILTLQPENLSEPVFIEQIKTLNPDIIILISYGGILSQKILSIPKIGSFNLHPSLLPKYRGPAPIEWVLVNGEKKTGLTVIKMETSVDKGNIIVQEEISIDENDNYFTLKDRLMEKSSGIWEKALKMISSGFLGFPQKGQSCYAPRLKKEDGHINWMKDTYSIHNLVRGFINWPGAFSRILYANKERILKIKQTEIEKHQGVYGHPGTLIFSDNSIKVLCGKGIIKIIKLQMEGKKEMLDKEFIHGYSKHLENSILH
jgi:methionyl-tRNA formyltransferase